MGQDVCPLNNMFEQAPPRQRFFVSQYTTLLLNGQIRGRRIDEAGEEEEEEGMIMRTRLNSIPRNITLASNSTFNNAQMSQRPDGPSSASSHPSMKS